MSNKDLLKQAIAEAKTIREAAIANAKEALEETLTPHLKEMLAQKLQEMEDADDETVDETINNAEAESYSENPSKHGNLEEAEEEEEEAEEEETPEEGEEGEEEEELEIEDMSVEDLKDLIRDIVAQEVGNDEEAEIETGEESEDDMTSVDDSEEIDINELLAELEGMDESSYTKNPKDSDKSGANDGFTNPSKRTPANSKHGNTYQAGAGHKPGRETYTNEGEEVNEDLQADVKALAAKYGQAFDAWITKTGEKIHGGQGLGLTKGAFKETVNEDLKADMEALASKYGKAFDAWITKTGEKIHGGQGLGLTKGAFKETVNEDLKQDVEALAAKYGKAFEDWITRTGERIHGGQGLGLNKPSRGIGMEEEVSEELNEALKAVRILRNQLQEVNLLNAKLLYVNKVFKSTNLSEGQKVNVIAAFDKAETVKEVKLVFETVSKNVVAKPAALKEHRSFASKATGNAQTTAPKEILSEVSEQVQRWQKLAGIIKS